MSVACPLSYRFGARALRKAPRIQCDTLFTVGGLYGNTWALRALLARARQEEQRTRVVFNGDFHFLNCTPEWWHEVSSEIRHGDVRGEPHAATLGNVEAESAADSYEGCGCGYPPYTSSGVAERSDEIVAQLHDSAHRARAPELLEWLRQLPLGMVVEVGPRRTRVGVVHGDPDSLAGWGLAVERQEPLDVPLRTQLGCGEAEVTPRARVLEWFRDADVAALLSTHTCLPWGQGVYEDGADSAAEPLVLFNNGSAGVPNFRGMRAGLMTRVSSDPTRPADSLYGVSSNGLRYDAIPICYDHDAFLAAFRDLWPEGSAASTSYLNRILHGPQFTVEQAARGGGVEVSHRVALQRCFAALRPDGA